MDQIVNAIASYLGINPALVPLILMVIVAIANLIGKSIPASAVGWKGYVRKIALVIGLYVPQRITPGVTTKNVASAIAAEVPDETIRAGASQLPTAVQTGVAAGVVAEALNDIAHGRTPGKPYVDGKSPEPDSVVPDEFRTDGPFQKQKGK